MEIRFRIKDLRINQKITLKELAKKAGLTASFLSQLWRSAKAMETFSPTKFFAVNVGLRLHRLSEKFSPTLCCRKASLTFAKKSLIVGF